MSHACMWMWLSPLCLWDTKDVALTSLKIYTLKLNVKMMIVDDMALGYD